MVGVGVEVGCNSAECDPGPRSEAGFVTGGHQRDSHDACGMNGAQLYGRELLEICHNSDASLQDAPEEKKLLQEEALLLLLRLRRRGLLFK